MQNAEIARLLSDVADLLEISAGNPFKVRAYRNAARTVADHADPIAELVAGGDFDLTDLPGMGGGIDAIDVAGSFRRRRETIGDLDIVVSCKNAAAVIQRFTKFGDVKEVASHGDTRST